MYAKYYDSPLGKLLLSYDGECLTGLWFDGQKYFPEDSFSVCGEEMRVFEETEKWLDIYFSGNDPGFIPKLSLNGTDFQKRVWEILLEVPYGKSISYGKIAELLGTRAFQAVGGAVGRNKIGIIVPCHRVLGKDGSLTGYAGGISRKKELLKLEKICFKA